MGDCLTSFVRQIFIPESSIFLVLGRGHQQSGLRPSFSGNEFGPSLPLLSPYVVVMLMLMLMLFSPPPESVDLAPEGSQHIRLIVNTYYQDVVVLIEVEELHRIVLVSLWQHRSLFPTML